jgi:hypothetical protein
MSDVDSAPISIKDRIAALQKGKNGDSTPIPIGPPPTKPKKSNALAGRIAALQIAAEKESSDKSESDNLPNKSDISAGSSSKVGKLKLPPGGVPIIMPGAGPPPSLLKKQKEREERKQKMIEDAQKEDAESAENASTKSSVGKLKLPPGAIKMIVPGCPPPAMSKTDGGAVEEASSEKKTTSAPDDALMSRPTMPKRRPRNHG